MRVAMALCKFHPVDALVKRHMLIMTPRSVWSHGDAPLVWHRMHGVNPYDCQETRLFPIFSLAAFRVCDTRQGRHFLVTDWLTGEWDVSWSWWIRRVRIPPALEWFEQPL